MIYFFFLSPGHKVFALTNPNTGDTTVGKYLGTIDCEAEDAADMSDYMQMAVDASLQTLDEARKQIQANRNSN